MRPLPAQSPGRHAQARRWSSSPWPAPTSQVHARGPPGPSWEAASNHIDGAPGEAALAQPSGLELFGRYLFFADAEVSSVRFLDLEQRQVGTLVGKGLFDFGDLDGLGEAVRLQHPLCVAVADGRVWVADTYNHKLKAISLRGGETETVVGPEGELCEPSGLARAGGYLIVADTGNHRLRVVRARDGAVRDLPVLGLGAP